MISLKSNGKLIGILAMLCIIVIGMFSVCAHAQNVGAYATLICNSSSSNGNHYASSYVMNTSSIDRYINTSVRNSSDTVLVSAGAKLGNGGSLSTGNVNINSQTGVYAHCWIYKSGAPESGVLTYMTDPIR